MRVVATWVAMGVSGTLILTGLRIGGRIDWSWWALTAPLWIPVLLLGAMVGGVLMAVLVLKTYLWWLQRHHLSLLRQVRKREYP